MDGNVNYQLEMLQSNPYGYIKWDNELQRDCGNYLVYTLTKDIYSKLINDGKSAITRDVYNENGMRRTAEEFCYTFPCKVFLLTSKDDKNQESTIFGKLSVKIQKKKKKKNAQDLDIFPNLYLAQNMEEKFSEEYFADIFYHIYQRHREVVELKPGDIMEMHL